MVNEIAAWESWVFLLFYYVSIKFSVSKQIIYIISDANAFSWMCDCKSGGSLFTCWQLISSLNTLLNWDFCGTNICQYLLSSEYVVVLYMSCAYWMNWHRIMANVLHAFYNTAHLKRKGHLMINFCRGEYELLCRGWLNICLTCCKYDIWLDINCFW